MLPLKGSWSLGVIIVMVTRILLVAGQASNTNTFSDPVSGAPGTSTGTFTGSKTGSTFSTPSEGITTTVTETFFSPSRTLTLTSVIPSGTSPQIPLSTQTTLSGPGSSSSGTLLSSGATVPVTMPTPSPSATTPGGTSASSSVSLTPTSTSGARHVGSTVLGTEFAGVILGVVAWVFMM